MKMSELRASQPAPVPPKPSQIAHAAPGDPPRAIRRLAAKAALKGRSRRVRKAQARILRTLGAAGMSIEGATAAQRRIAGR